MGAERPVDHDAINRRRLAEPEKDVLAMRGEVAPGRHEVRLAMLTLVDDHACPDQAAMILPPQGKSEAMLVTASLAAEKPDRFLDPGDNEVRSTITIEIATGQTPAPMREGEVVPRSLIDSDQFPSWGDRGVLQ